MITEIGTPASQRTTSRIMRVVSLAYRHAPAVAEGEARRDRSIAVVTSTHRRPPAGSERDDQSRGCDKTGQDRCMASLVGGGSRCLHGIVDPPLGLLLSDTSPLAHKLGETSAAFRSDRAGSDGTGEYAGHFRPRVLAGSTTVGTASRSRRGGGCTSLGRIGRPQHCIENGVDPR